MNVAGGHNPATEQGKSTEVPHGAVIVLPEHAVVSNGLFHEETLAVDRHKMQYDNNAASFFDRFNAFTGRDALYAGYISGHLANNPSLTEGGGIAVDFGCGTGWLTNILAKEFGQVIGLDSSPEMLKLAWANTKQHIGQVQLHQTAPEEVKGQCSFIAAVHVHYHFSTRETLVNDFFKAAAEMLKPGGQLLVIGCPSDHIRETPDHYHNMIRVEDVPEDVRKKASQLSFLQDGEGYIRLNNLPSFELKDGTQMKACFQMLDVHGALRELSLTDTYWSDATLAQAAMEAGLNSITKVNLPLRGHQNAYMAMLFRKGMNGSANGSANGSKHPQHSL